MFDNILDFCKKYDIDYELEITEDNERHLIINDEFFESDFDS